MTAYTTVYFYYIDGGGGSEIMAPPRILDIRPRTIDVIQGEIVQIFCNAEGQPSPRVTWLRNGQAFSSGPNLFIRSAQRSDEGEIICKAENSAGFFELSAYIYVRPTPNGKCTYIYIYIIYYYFANNKVSKICLYLSRSKAPSSRK
jgi:hypothetical protein